MESHARLTDVRQRMANIKEDALKIKLFEDFQREEYTRNLAIQRQHARPKRLMKQKWELLKCVNSFNVISRKEEDFNDMSDVDDILQRFKKVRAKIEKKKKGMTKEWVPKNDFQRLEQMKKNLDKMKPCERERQKDEIKSKTAKINIESLERVKQDKEENKERNDENRRQLESNFANTKLIKRLEHREAVKKHFYDKIKKENEEILKTTLFKETSNTLK